MARIARNGWLLFAAGLALLAVASVTAASIRARSNGCIFDDGAAYCRMASGKLAQLPFARRVAVPALVSSLPSGWSVAVRFQLVALVAAAGATIATGLLTLHLVRERATPQVAYPAALAGAALVALSPHLFRMALTEPVLVDQAAIFLGLVWCLLVTARARWLRWLSPLVVLLMVPTREAWVLPLLVATGMLWWMRGRVLAAATLVATLSAATFTFTRPSSPGGPWSHFSSVTQVLHDGRVTLTHPDHALWSVFFGVGLSAALGFLLFTRRDTLRGPIGLLLGVACAHLVQAPLAGTDVSRYAAAAVPFAVVLAIVAAVELRSTGAFRALVGLTAATVLLWQPFRIAGAGVRSYFSMYYPTGAASTVIALGGVALVAATLTWLLRSEGAIPGHRGSRVASASR